MSKPVLTQNDQAGLDGVRYRLACGKEPSRVDVEILVRLVEAAYQELRK